MNMTILRVVAAALTLFSQTEANYNGYPPQFLLPPFKPSDLDRSLSPSYCPLPPSSSPPPLCFQPPPCACPSYVILPMKPLPCLSPAPLAPYHSVRQESSYLSSSYLLPTTSYLQQPLYMSPSPIKCNPSLPACGTPFCTCGPGCCCKKFSCCCN